ncbi:hypothetical protein [Actinopolymorpha rutila]|uniref:PKD domain-containing protein n=1 Tax=Actinopolymorpha rutila TaxID=446787 RepID=A0A852ZNX0_9ACTN|nr:hypothetical protein [Actinopolymorpha rutila]NYH90186.1 hypothetical protein [Actinopolymorpha rutila]
MRLACTLVLALGITLLAGPVLTGTAYAECGIGTDGKWHCGGGDPGGPGGPGGPDGPGGPGNPGPAPKQPYDTYATPACMVNGPPPGDPNAMCMNAAQACKTRGEKGIMMRYYVQWDQNGPWELVRTGCSGATNPNNPPPPVTPQQVERWLVNGWLPKSNVGVSPGNGHTLINFPTIFYANQTVDYDADRYVPDGSGRVIHVTAEATGFDWHWGDGSAATHTDKPGQKYADSVPQDAYVTHPFEKPGRYTVSVDVQWSGRFEVPGEGQQTFGPVTVPRGRPAPVTVLEKQDVLSD